MVEQFGGIGNPGILPQSGGLGKASGVQGAGGGDDFKSVLMQSINEVNRLQAEADEAVTNLATQRTDNVAEVFTAVKKAELAFQTLMQIRNKLESAYDEIKQMRV